jgi:hypothetical protein
MRTPRRRRMLYKTIVLELIQSHPVLHNRLRLSRKLMTEMERYASDLRTSHQEYSQSHPQDTALELAVADIETRIAHEAVRLAT